MIFLCQYRMEHRKAIIRYNRAASALKDEQLNSRPEDILPEILKASPAFGQIFRNNWSRSRIKD